MAVNAASELQEAPLSVHDAEVQKLSSVEKFVIFFFGILVMACMIGFGILCMTHYHMVEGIIILFCFILIFVIIGLFRVYNSNVLKDIAKTYKGTCLKIVEGNMVYDDHVENLQLCFYRDGFERFTFDSITRDYQSAGENLIEYSLIDDVILQTNQLLIFYHDHWLKNHVISIQSEKSLKLILIHDVLYDQLQKLDKNKYRQEGEIHEA